MATSFALTGEQKNELAAAIEAPPQVPDFARTGEKNPNLRVFVVNFDGTQNDRDNVPKGDKQTLVADNFVRFRDSEDDAVATRYYKGVGTVQYLPTTRIVQSATGMGCISNAEQAHQDFCAQAKEWLEENPNAEIHVHVVGFSRGSATALHFLNLVDQRGAVPENGLEALVPERLHGGRVSSSAVLLDTVSTGQGDRLELTIPDSCVAALHIVAKDEQRALFPMREISAGIEQEIALANGASMPGVSPDADGNIHYHRVQEIKLPGVHSDIGGSYIDGGIANISGYLMDSFQQSLGLDVKPVKPTAEQVQSCRLHDSRFGIEKFLVGDTPNTNTERYVQKVQSDRWDGTWGIQTRLDSWDDTREIKSFETRQARFDLDASASEPSFKDAGEPLLGKSLQVMLMPESRQNTFGGQAEFSKEGIRAVVISKDSIDGIASIADIRPDGLYIAGQKIKGSPSVQEIHQHWDDQIASGIPPAPINFKMDAWRVGTTAVCGQDPTVKVAPPEPPAEDPWPRAVRSNLRLLNSSPNMKPKHAEKSLELAAKAVANALIKDNPLIASAKIVPISVTERTSSSTIHTNRFAIECTDIHGKTMSTENPPTTRAERDMHERLCGLARGMNAVSDGLAKIGFKPQANVPYVYARDVSEKMNDARMQPYPNAPKPAIIDQRVEGPMPQPESSLGDKLNNLRHKAGGVVLDLATKTIRKAMGT